MNGLIVLGSLPVIYLDGLKVMCQAQNIGLYHVETIRPPYGEDIQSINQLQANTLLISTQFLHIPFFVWRQKYMMYFIEEGFMLESVPSLIRQPYLLNTITKPMHSLISEHPSFSGYTSIFPFFIDEQGSDFRVMAKDTMTTEDTQPTGKLQAQTCTLLCSSSDVNLSLFSLVVQTFEPSHYLYFGTLPESIEEYKQNLLHIINSSAYCIWVCPTTLTKFTYYDVIIFQLILLLNKPILVLQQKKQNEVHSSLHLINVPQWSGECGQFIQLEENEPIQTFNEMKTNFLETLSTYQPATYIRSLNHPDLFFEYLKRTFIQMYTPVLVAVTSMIYTPNTPLSYTNVRSIYTPEQRIQQTQDTIQSILKHMPWAKIVVVEASNISSSEEQLLLQAGCDQVYRVKNTSLNYSKAKGAGEITSLLEFLDSNKTVFYHFFKVSGRYKLKDTFDVQQYLATSNNVVKSRTTTLYKIHASHMNDYTQRLRNIVQRDDILQGLTSIEDTEYFDPNVTTMVSTLHLCGNIAVSGDYVDQ